jgi:TRAP-type C4-dicarboxylate transport system permease small subunit
VEESKLTVFSSPGKTYTFLVKTVHCLTKVIELVTRLTNYMALVVLSVMALFTGISVLLRYIFNKPIPGDMELTQFMMAIVVAAAIGYCAFKKGHIIVDILFVKLSQKTRAIFNIFHYLIGAILFALVCWRTGMEALVVQERNLTSPVLLIPIFPFYWVVAIGSGILCLTWFYNVIESLSKAAAPPSQDMGEKPQGSEK